MITSRASSLPEIAGDAALYVDPYDVASIGGAMDDMVNQPALRCKMGEAGMENAKRFDQNTYIERLSNLYDSLLA